MKLQASPSTGSNLLASLRGSHSATSSSSSPSIPQPASPRQQLVDPAPPECQPTALRNPRASATPPIVPAEREFTSGDARLRSILLALDSANKDAPPLVIKWVNVGF